MYSVIILCAGQGKRTGLNYNKMLYKFQGQTVYEMTLHTFMQDPRCQQIIVVTREDEKETFQQLLDDERIQFVVGGKERQDSVFHGLQHVQSSYVLIHDGARPYLKQQHIDALLLALQEHQACLLMVPCKDTIKRVVDGKVVETLKRDELMQAQTPQAFSTKLILEAYTQAIQSGYQATDDAQMVEHFTQEDVYAVMGDYENKKITTVEDLK
ncbi:2-C-methyl-D-erythritol 4-phosphate cytidylyltransferase [Allocoprobacillus halotolerans]|uniref:2-C-methyl-D-erythritol 4-phosphate cytidylyltransferase n=1 Tax=Allocoprobacillus halotolerans TaxID=2944914 RepID=A0ABY5I836_9FIRM|nr:2-C-methyl-D-erythritol 4-phosphate cytidylyltransferase [Allocoprobacillus halotolerans]UTY40198.1 2-C-methyl-D-erythritol 4-phosphate cytidylyltransferase [Allocoprobacillus halotolerans]